MYVKLIRVFTSFLFLFMVVVTVDVEASQRSLGHYERGKPVGEIRHFVIQLWIGQNKAMVNGEMKTLDLPPMLYKSRTMVPLRFIAESFGADVKWDAVQKKVMLFGYLAKESDPSQKTQIDVILKIDQNQAFINNEVKTLDIPPILHKGRTMVPLRFVAEALGADVQWNSAEKSVTITLKQMTLDAFINTTTWNFREEIKVAMNDAASKAKIKLSETEPVVIIGKKSGSAEPSIKIVNTAIEGADTFTIEQIAKGVDLLFVFLQLPQGSELSTGFYIIRISGDLKTNKWIAHFKNTDKRIALEKPAKLEKEISALYNKVKLTAKISFPGPTITLDIHSSSISIQTAFRLGNGSEDTILLTEEKCIAQSNKKALDAFISATTKALTQSADKYAKDILDEWLCVCRYNDLFVSYTVFKDVNEFTVEELAKGQDVFLGYFRTPQGSKLPSGFYKVNIIQECGQWLCQFINDQNEIVFKAPAEVTGGKYTIKAKSKGELTADIGYDFVTINYYWTNGIGIEYSVAITVPFLSKKIKPVPDAEVIVDYITQIPAESTCDEGNAMSEKTQFDLILKSIKCKTNEEGEFSFSIHEEQFKKLPERFYLEMTIIPPKGWIGISSSNKVTVKVKKSYTTKFVFILLWEEENDIKTNKGTFAVSSKAQT